MTAPALEADPRTSVLKPQLMHLGASVAPYIVMATLWQIASLFLPPFLFPSLVDVFWRCISIFTDWSQLVHVLATVGRILAGLAGAFIVGAALAMLMVRSRLL